MLNLSKNDFAKYWISKLNDEIINKNYVGKFFIDFTIIKIDLPFDFTPGEFIDSIYESFNTEEIKINYLEIQDIGHKLRIVSSMFRNIPHDYNAFIYKMNIPD